MYVRAGYKQVKHAQVSWWRRSLTLILGVFLYSSIATAQEGRVPLPEPFVPSEELQGRVDFWRLIFTKYGEDQLVFHHRSHPEIIYSVLDFSEVRQTKSGKNLARYKENQVREEIIRIQQALNNLAAGKKASTSFERRIEQLFHQIVGNRQSYYRDASTADQIRFQTGIRERFREGVRRSRRYLHAIEMIFQDAGLPTELARLPLVESSFDYKAYSSKGAAGIWQFTRYTGKAYMRINASLDERRDPILSSRAAARYLANSYEKLRSWPLAITSYNHGLSGVMRAVRQTGSRDISEIIKRYEGESFGFASSNFYAEFLAALDVERNAKYYFPNLDPESPWFFDEVRLERPVQYRTILSALEIEEEELHKHNLALLPPIRNGRVSLPAGFLVKVPQGSGTKLASALSHGTVHTITSATEHFNENIVNMKKENRRQMKEDGSGYTVSTGDTVGSIARRFGVSQKELMAVNDLTDPRKLRVGKKILIPQKMAKVNASPPPKSSKKVILNKSEETQDVASLPEVTSQASTYVVKKGDTLVEIAKKHGITTATIKRLNPRLGKTIYPGEKLVIQ